MKKETLINSDFAEMQRVFSIQKEKAISLRTSTPRERRRKLIDLKKWVLGNEEKICIALHKDFKKSEVETKASEIMPVLAEIKYTIKNLKEWMRPTSASVPLLFLGTSNKLHREPKGTSLIIAPWNYPFHLMVKPLVSAIAAGCTVIMKPSEMTTHTAQLITEMSSELFSEDEVYTFTGGADVAINLQKLPFDHIFFTGSPAVGKMVMTAAAKHLTSVTLELGGKSPVIVDETADISATAASLLYGKFLNAGQTCVAPDYTFVHESVHDKLIDQLSIHLEKMSGENIAESEDYCRIINENHYSRVSQLLNNAKEKGAQVKLGGLTRDTDNFIQPSILTEVTDEMDIMQEEVFGPILPIMKYKDLAEPIAYINKNEKPLALYIFSKSGRNKRKINKETSAGATVINDLMIQVIYKGMPFGGVNNSGIGKTGGEFGFLEFTNLKASVTNHLAATSLFHPPYKPWVQKLVDVAMKYLS